MTKKFAQPVGSFSISNTNGLKKLSAFLTLALSLNLQLGVAQCASAASLTPVAHAAVSTHSSGAVHNPLNLDLSSTKASLTAPSSIGGSHVNIKSGNSNVQVNAASLLTPSQRVAVWQVLNTGVQSITIGSHGNAIGGSLNLGAQLSSSISNLVIPRGVKTFDNASNLNVLGNLTNSGSLHVQNALNSLASISAQNITNNVGASITSLGSLNLLAASNITNYGTISSQGSLTLNAGTSVLNSSSAGNSATISAAHNLNLITPNLTNSGLISAGSGNINISSLSSNINVNNTAGTLAALNGDINVRDAAFAGKYDLNLSGGNLLSNHVNLWSGNGVINVRAENITGQVNASACDIHVSADGPNLILGNIQFQDDPTFFNTGGNIIVSSDISQSMTGGVAPGVAIVASGDITSLTGGAINVNNGTGNAGFPLLIVAGANFTTTPSTAQTGGITLTGSTSSTIAGDTSTILTIAGGSGTGGKIDLSAFTTAISTVGTGAGTPGGSVTLVAFGGSAPLSGTVNVNDITSSGGTPTAGGIAASNGTVTIIGGAKADPSAAQTAITTGSITTNVISHNGAGGGILIATGNPVVTGGSFQVLNGLVQGGSATASLGFSSINHGASITTGSLTTNTAPVTLVAGNNVTLAAITTQGVNTLSPVGPGGNVSVFAGGSIGQATGASNFAISTNPTASGNDGGQVIMVAGANVQANATHVFLTGGTADDVALNLNVLGATSAGGNINLANLTAINTIGGAASTVTNAGARGGSVQLVAFSSLKTAGNNGQVQLPNVQITSGGSSNGLLQSPTANVNGDVTVSAGGKGTGTPVSATINIGGSLTGTSLAIDTSGGASGGNEGGGNITVVTASPNASGLPFSYQFDYNAATTPLTVTGSFTPSSTLQSASITLGNVLAVGGNYQVPAPANGVQTTRTTSILVSAGQNLSIGSVTNVNNTLPVGGSPGMLSSSTITLSAVGVMTLNGDISSNAASSTVNFAATTTSGSNVLTNVANVTGLFPGTFVTGAGLPDGTFIQSINSAAQTVTLSSNAIASATISASELINGASGGTITLHAASYVVNNSATVGADGTNGYYPFVPVLALSGDLTNGSATVSNVPATNGVVAGTFITGTNIPANTFIQSFTPNFLFNSDLSSGNPIINVSTTVDPANPAVTLQDGTIITGPGIPAGSFVAPAGVGSLVTISGAITSGSTTITGVTNAAQLVVGGTLTLANSIAPGTTITAINVAAQTVTISTAAQATNPTASIATSCAAVTLNQSVMQTATTVSTNSAGAIVLSTSASGSGSGTNLVNFNPNPIGSNGGDGGNISITTTGTTNSTLTVGSIGTATGFAGISAMGGNAGGNAGTISLKSATNILLDPTKITAQAVTNPLANINGTGTSNPSLSGLSLIASGTGATINLTAATTLLITGTLNVNGAPSGITGNTGNPGGNGGVININVSSNTPFNIGGIAPSSTTGNGSIGSLTANGNNFSSSNTAAFGSGGSISVTNAGTGGVSLANLETTEQFQGDISAGSNIILNSSFPGALHIGESVSGTGLPAGTTVTSINGATIGLSYNATVTGTASSFLAQGVPSIQVQGANATTSANLGTAQQTFVGGNGGHILLKGTNVISLAPIDASGGASSAERGSGDGGSIEIDTKSTNIFTVNPAAAVATVKNGVIGSLTANGNVGTLTVANATPTAFTVYSQDPTGSGGSISLNNTGGGMTLAAAAAISVAAANANSALGLLGGTGGNIHINTSGTLLSSISLNANGGTEDYTGNTLPTITATSAVNNNTGTPLTSVTIPVSSTAGLFVGQTVSIQGPGPSGNPLDQLLIQSVTPGTSITVFQVADDFNSGATVQAYFASGNGGTISVSSKNTTALAVNNTFSMNANGFNGGSVAVTNLGTGGITIANNNVFSANAIAPVNANTNPKLVAFSGFGGNLSVQSPAGTVSIGSSLSVNGATGQTALGIQGPNIGGNGGNITIVSKSSSAFTVGAASAVNNGVFGALTANGGAAAGGNGNAGTITVVNTGAGGISVGGNPQLSLSVQPGTGPNGAPGNGGSVTLTATAGPVFIASSLDASGGQAGFHDASFADGLGGSISITSNSATAFNVGTGVSNGITGTLTANGWSGGSISVTNLGKGGIAVGSGLISNIVSNIQVTADAASSTVTQIGQQDQSLGGPGGSVSLQAPTGPVSISGTLDASGGAQQTGTFLQGGNGGQITILSGKATTPFNVGGAATNGNGSTAPITANGAVGGIVNITANSGGIIISAAANISVAGFAGDATAPTPSGNGGSIYLQATGTSGFVFINGSSSSGGLDVSGTAGSSGQYLAGAGGKIAIVTNSATPFNVGSAATNSNGLGTGGAQLLAEGYNGGSISIKNLGTGGIAFAPNLISISSAQGASGGTTDLPGGNGGAIDLQAPLGNLVVTALGTLNADATASTNGQTGANGGIISVGAKQIVTTSGLGLKLSAKGNGTGNGGTVVMNQTVATTAQALSVGTGTNLNIDVGAGAVGGNILISAAAGIVVPQSLSTSSNPTPSGSLSLTVNGPGSISESGTSLISAGTLNLVVATAGTGSGGIKTTVSNLSVLSTGGSINISNNGDLTITSAVLAKGLLGLVRGAALPSLNIATNGGSLTVGTGGISSFGAISLTASDSNGTGNITVNGNIVGPTVNLTATGNSSGGGAITSNTPAIISASAGLALSSGVGGISGGVSGLNTATGFLTLNANNSTSISVSNYGPLLFSLGGSSTVGTLSLQNTGNITTFGGFTAANNITLDSTGQNGNGSITLGGTVGTGSATSSVTLNSGGSIVQAAGTVIKANAITLSSLNGNVGLLTRAFTNGIYTPGGIALNVDVANDGGGSPGTLTVNTVNSANTSAGTVNVAIINSTANPTGSANIQGQAGGDLQIASNMTSGGSLSVSSVMSSSYGAITILNSSTTGGDINVGANMAANGGPLVVENNNLNGQIVVAPALNLSGVGWFVNSLDLTASANTRTGVALISGAFPAVPALGTIPSGITAPGTAIVFYGTGLTVPGLNNIVTASIANIAFQGNSASTITLGSGTNISATSMQLVITSLDLTNPTVVTNLIALQGNAPGVTGTLVKGGTGTINFDPTQTTTFALNLSNLSGFNLPKATSIVNFNNFAGSNPVAVNVNTFGTGASASITGKVNFQSSSNGTANSFPTDAHLSFNSSTVGTVLTEAAGAALTSDSNLSLNVGGSANISGTISAGANNTLSLFTSGASATTPNYTSTSVAPGTLTLTNAVISAGQLNDAGTVIIDVNGINSTGATTRISGANLTLNIGGSNFEPVPFLIIKNPPISVQIPGQIVASKLAGIPTILAGVLNINAGSGANVALTGGAASNIENLVLNVQDTPVSITQSPSISIGAGLSNFIGSITAGTNVLNVTNTNVVALNGSVSGFGIPAGTSAAAVNQQVSFTGDVAGTAITNVTNINELSVGTVITAPGIIPAGATIVSIDTVGDSLTYSGAAGTSTTGASVNQLPFVTLSNQATASASNASLHAGIYPGTLNSLTIVSSNATTGGISTNGNIACATCTFTASSLTNLNTISTTNAVGTIKIGTPTGAGLTITQTDGVLSGTIAANAALTISAAKTINLIGGTLSTAAGNLVISETGPALNPLNINGTTMNAGTFNGSPLGPTIAFTDVSSSGAIMVTTGAGGINISNSASFHSIGQNIRIVSTGPATIQGVFLADGGNINILNSNTTLSATDSTFTANALGNTATNSTGGVIEISAGSNISRISSLPTVPGTIPVTPLFNQVQAGPPQPLGSNVNIDNNSGGFSPFQTGAIVSTSTGTLNLGATSTGAASNKQTSLFLNGGGLIFTSATATSSLLIDGSTFTTNAFTPLAATSGGDALEIAMDETDGQSVSSLAHMFVAGHDEGMVLTSNGILAASKAHEIGASQKGKAEFTLKSGSAFLNLLGDTLIHSDFADIKARKGALLSLSVEAGTLRVAACSGPGDVSMVIDGKTIVLCAGEEVTVSAHKLSTEERTKADGIGRRNFDSYSLSSGVHVSTCEISLLSLQSNWNQFSKTTFDNGAAKAISAKMLKTAAAISVITQNHGAYQARPAQHHSDSPVFMPVRYELRKKAASRNLAFAQ